MPYKDGRYLTDEQFDELMDSWGNDEVADEDDDMRDARNDEFDEWDARDADVE